MKKNMKINGLKKECLVIQYMAMPIQMEVLRLVKEKHQTFCGMGQTQIRKIQRTNLSFYIKMDAINNVFKLILLK
jgi:hypothetical protein